MTLTRDAIFRGEMIVYQPERGFRFAVDSILLGWFSCARHVRLAVDLGSGSGVIGFVLLGKGAASRVLGVEIDPVMAEAARLGAGANGFGTSYEVVEADLRDRSRRDLIPKADLVVANPPWRRSGTGRTSPIGARAGARHDATCTMEDLLEASASLLRPRARLCSVLPSDRLEEFVVAATGRRLHVTRLRFVHPLPDRPARMVLLEARLGASEGSAVVQPPIFVHSSTGVYSALLEEILAGRFRVSAGTCPRP